MEQRDEIALDIKAAFEAAASAGYNAKAMKKAIRVASMAADKREAHNAEQLDIELYLAELEGRQERERAAA
jgi:uncharacterized protein (UPF0335 family)